MHLDWGDLVAAAGLTAQAAVVLKRRQNDKYDLVEHGI
jgi:hypothetical protein